MYGCDLRLKGRVDETMPCKGGLFVEERRDDSCFEGLTASAYVGGESRVRSLAFVLNCS